MQGFLRVIYSFVQTNYVFQNNTGYRDKKYLVRVRERSWFGLKRSLSQDLLWEFPSRQSFRCLCIANVDMQSNHRYFIVKQLQLISLKSDHKDRRDLYNFHYLSKYKVHWARNHSLNTESDEKITQWPLSYILHSGHTDKWQLSVRYNINWFFT